MGDLEVLGDEYARRLRDAVEERPALRSPVPFTSTSRWVTAGAGRSSTVRALLGKELANESHRRAAHRRG